MVGSRLNPLLMKRGDDLGLPVISSVADDSLLTDDQLAEITANIDDAVERYKKHSVNGPVFDQLPPTEVGGLFLSSVVERLKADSLPKDSVL